jgi:Protein of unknown function (DUF3237)
VSQIVSKDHDTSWRLAEADTSYDPAVNQMTFETGAERYRALENALFVGAGRVVTGEDGALTVEYQVSQVGSE